MRELINDERTRQQDEALKLVLNRRARATVYLAAKAREREARAETILWFILIGLAAATAIDLLLAGFGLVVALWFAGWL